MALLRVEGVTRRFGGVLALDDVTLDVPAGEIVGLIGPNGAGKTTLFNVVSRFVPADGGTVAFGGADITRAPAHRLAALGIARTFQNLELFEGLTVRQNVEVGAHRFGRDAPARARRALDRLGQRSIADSRVGDLPYAIAKQVELARALAADPRLLLLDEPAGGHVHEEVEQLAALVRSLRDDDGITILLVEHHMGLVMGVSDRVHVLSFGRRIASGPPAAVQADPAVVEAYLGVPEAGAA